MNTVSTSRRTVNGTPSLTLKRREGGGVVAELKRNSPNANMIVPADLTPLRREVEAAAEDARRYSKGTITALQKRRRLIGNRLVINRRSGLLLRSYRSDVARTSRGASIRVENTAPYSDYVMRGTSRIRARGPLLHVMRKRLRAFDREWQAVGRKAAQRQRDLEAVRISGNPKVVERLMEQVQGVMR